MSKGYVGVSPCKCFIRKLPVYAYSCGSEEVPNEIPEKVCLHYIVLFHLRQFMPPLYGQRLEISLMLMSSYPIQCHYIPRVDEHMQKISFPTIF